MHQQGASAAPHYGQAAREFSGPIFNANSKKEKKGKKKTNAAGAIPYNSHQLPKPLTNRQHCGPVPRVGLVPNPSAKVPS